MSVQKVPEMGNARKATKLKLTISTMCAVMFALFSGAAMAQTAPAPAPGTQKPTSPAPTAPAPAAPAPAAPAAQAPAAPAAPPKPFPEGAKIAYVSVGHRSTLKQFHDYLLMLHVDGSWELDPIEPDAAAKRQKKSG